MAVYYSEERAIDPDSTVARNATVESGGSSEERAIDMDDPDDGSEPRLEFFRRVAGEPPLIHYDLAAKTQIAVDAVLTAAGCSGVLRDLVSGDWVIWESGKLIGWDKTADGAVRRLAACQRAKAEHEGGAS